MISGIEGTGIRLRITRKAKGLTQRQLGALVGCSQGSIDQIETGAILQPRILMQVAGKRIRITR